MLKSVPHLNMERQIASSHRPVRFVKAQVDQLVVDLKKPSIRQNNRAQVFIHFFILYKHTSYYLILNIEKLCVFEQVTSRLTVLSRELNEDLFTNSLISSTNRTMVTCLHESLARIVLRLLEIYFRQLTKSYRIIHYQILSNTSFGLIICPQLTY